MRLVRRGRDVEVIERKPDLVAFTQLQRVVRMEIQLVVRRRRADGSAAADRDFSGIIINRVCAQLADWSSGAAPQTDAGRESFCKAGRNHIRTIQISGLPAMRRF